jgi:hypothetical protein
MHVTGNDKIIVGLQGFGPSFPFPTNMNSISRILCSKDEPYRRFVANEMNWHTFSYECSFSLACSDWYRRSIVVVHCHMVWMYACIYGWLGIRVFYNLIKPIPYCQFHEQFFRTFQAEITVGKLRTDMNLLPETSPKRPRLYEIVKYSEW